MSEKKYIVTGGAGFIGSNIVRKLVKEGAKVKVIDNLLTGNKDNLKSIINDIEFVEGDIRNLDLLQKEFNGFHFVLHQAALPSVPRSLDDPISSNSNNIDGTLNVLVAARDQKIKRVIYAASSSAYGDIKEEYKSEDMVPHPLSPYALQKYTGEVYCQLFYKLYGLETLVLRYFNVFGPYQNPASQYAAVIPKFITSILNGKQPVIYGDGTQSRDFTYVANNVEANILAANSENGVGETINIACGGNINLNDLVLLINKELKTNIEPIYESPKAGDVKNSKADISKARSVLKYQPSTNFKDGLRETIKWYQKSETK